MNIEMKRNSQSQDVELCYGMKEGTLIHISEAVSGLECGCQCPACGSSLIARKGDVRKHHFAHQQGQDTRSCLETVLHLMAKQIIAEQKKILLPDTYLKAEKRDDAGNLHNQHIYEKGLMASFTQISLEVARDNYRADAVGYLESFGELDIEIRVTHEVDKEKADKVRSINKPMMEVDLSELPRDAGPEDILEAVLYTAP
ncbi:competence protein CoiA family protein, partial [Sansalvadorimonas verongulae]|uniref:competence protein CoiA family protein n=1 Tax=Sansalvadorimonas verongulae TaxID=2172824 RepID=UPI001E4761E8